MTTLFDTSAVIALVDSKNDHHKWSYKEYNSRKMIGPIVISDIVYSEISAGMKDKNAVDLIISQFGFQRGSLDDSALYAAGQRYALYRKTKGTKTNVLPDFFIGAYASTQKIPLVTANPKDFRNFFSGLTIVHPKGEETVP